MESELSTRVENKFQVLEKKLECADASTFHIQGNSQIVRNLNGLAVVDFCAATMGYLRGNDELNGKRTLRLIEETLPRIDKIEYGDNELDKEIDQLIEFLKGINDNNRYSDHMSNLVKERKAAMMREPKTA